MTSKAPPAKSDAIIKLSGQSVGSDGVPAEVLIYALQGMQQLVYIMASDKESKKLSQRFRVSDDIEQRYKLICKLPEKGSYVVPLALAHERQLSFFPQRVEIFELLDRFFSALSSEDNSVISLFSDRTFARRALNEVRKFLPKADDSWNFGYRSAKAKKEAVLTKDSVKHVDELLMQQVPIEDCITITGELIKIDFDERKVFLRYPPTKQQIECIYSDESEDIMIENRRQYVQVTGVFTLDASGMPIKLTDVTRIEPLDLSPIILTEVSYKKHKYRFKNVIKMTPELEDDDKQFLTVCEKNLGIMAFARNREDLVAEIAQQINHLWNEYAICDDKRLTKEAKLLKKALLQLIEVKDAS